MLLHYSRIVDRYYERLDSCNGLVGRYNRLIYRYNGLVDRCNGLKKSLIVIKTVEAVRLHHVL